jgi:hypothetical protein
MIYVVASALALALAPESAVHTVEISHAGTLVKASYEATENLRTKQIGMAAGPRQSKARCLWTADIGVTRKIVHKSGAEIAHRLDENRVLTGNQPGQCTQVSKQIKREVASKRSLMTEHLVEVATHDETRLRQDLDAMRQIAHR